MDQKRWTNPQHSTQLANVSALRIVWPRLEVVRHSAPPYGGVEVWQSSQSKTNNTRKTKTMKPQDKNTIAELVSLLSEAIDILRNRNEEDNADYLEKEMQKTLQQIVK
jgi:hypothetical protein